MNQATNRPMSKRLALCNEVLAPWTFERQCSYASALGYAGLEVAPYTLHEDPMQITDAMARRYRAIAADHGLVVSGLHWLLVAPKDLSISSPDGGVRQRTREVMFRLIELCVQLGAQYLVHGSPAQRNPQPGQTVADALARATECWQLAGERATSLGVTYCIEPLSPNQTPIINTVAEAAAIVQKASMAGLKTMIDTCSACVAEAEPLDTLIDRWWPTGLLAHIQLNDRNRRGPGQGDDKFAPMLAALQRQGYGGWLAMEPFDYQPDGAACAAYSVGYVRGLLEAMPELRGVQTAADRSRR